MKVIELKDVKKSYGKNEILHGISLDIEEGSDEKYEADKFHILHEFLFRA